MYKSAITNFKNGNIRHFRIRKLKNSRSNKVIAIDTIICLEPEENVPAKIFFEGKWKKSEVLLGDTDTNAAITGAYYGYDKIIENDITKQNIEIMLNSDSTTSDIVRPLDYKLEITLMMFKRI